MALVFSRLASAPKVAWAAFQGLLVVLGLGAAKRTWDRRMSQALSFFLFGAIGLALLSAALWYGLAVWDVFFRENIAALGEIKVLGRSSDDAKAIEAGLPRLLVAELRRQREELNRAILELTDVQKRSETVAQPQVEGAFKNEIVRVIEKPVYPDLKIGDVDVGALVRFVGDQRTSGDVLSLSISFVPSSKKDTPFDRVLAYGHQTGANGYSFVATVPQPTIDDIASAVASGILAVNIRRMDKAFEALNGEEFGQLLSILKGYAEIVRRRPLVSEPPIEDYQGLSSSLRPLARKYSRWESLQRFALKTAEESKDTEGRLEYSRAVQAILLSRQTQGTSDEALLSEIERLQTQISQLSSPSKTSSVALIREPICGPKRSKQLVDAYQPVRQRIGLDKSRPAKGVRVAVVGGVPPKSLLDQVDHKLTAGAERRTDPSPELSDYVASILTIMCQIAEDITFLFSPLVEEGPGSVADSKLLSSLNDLATLEPNIILFTFGTPGRNDSAIYRAVFDRLAERKALIVTAAGNNGPTEAAWRTANARGLRVAAVGVNGKPTSFSQRDDGVVWAPGENIGIPRNGVLQNSSGTSWASAVAAAAAAILIAKYPKASLAEIRKAIVDTSRPVDGGDVPVINVEAALKALGSG
jgi:hypothetical protein